MQHKQPIAPWLVLGLVGAAAATWFTSRSAQPDLDARTRERLARRGGK